MATKTQRQALSLMAAAALFVGWASPAFAQTESGATVGVYVEETIPPTTVPPTTMAPTTTVAPPPTTSAPATTTAPATTEAPATTLPAAQTQDVPTSVPVTEAPTIKEEVAQAVEKSFAGSVVTQAKAAASVAKKFVTKIADGAPVASVAEAILPAPVATVVVPAVRTASTFAFPIGVAFAVLAFLVLQQRIDSHDPKLTAAPIAHEDDVVVFQ